MPPTTDCADDPELASLPEGEIREKLQSATCLSQSAKLLDATAAARTALELTTKQKDTAVMKIARRKMVDLVERTPHFTFVRPRGVTLTSLTVDNRAIPLHALEQKHAFDPGRHHVVATGLAGGRSVSMRSDETLAERRFVQIQLDLR